MPNRRVSDTFSITFEVSLVSDVNLSVQLEEISINCETAATQDFVKIVRVVQ